MDKPLTPPQIRDADLPRSLRGFDIDATRGLLASAAAALASATRERDDLRNRVEQLSEQAARNPTDAERLGAVLLTAKRAADDLLAKANQEAAEIRAGADELRADAERRRDDLFARARTEADGLVREAAVSVELLGQEADKLRRSISMHRQELVTFLRTALEQLDGVESLGSAVAEPPRLDGELLAQLPTE
jgi:cell division septum initiation protein DivIVA